MKNTNSLRKFKANKKTITFGAVALLIVSVMFVYFRFIYVSNEWYMRISDISKDCQSNMLNVYPGKDYIVVSAYENKIIDRGVSTYAESLDYLDDKIKSYSIDDELNMNYRIEYKSGLKIDINQNKSPEIDSFLKTLDTEDVFWCS